jgi:hypothetical protein
MTDVRKGRQTLVLIAFVFAAPILIAALLALSGWRPEGRRNYGELVDPPIRIEQPGVLADGAEFPWATPQWHWTLVMRIPMACDMTCAQRLDQVGNLRISLGRHAEKLRIAIDRPVAAGSVLGRASGVYVLADMPFPLAARIDAADRDLTLALVDPAGYLMLSYPERADLKLVRKDLGKLIR